jgi:hypothetical protein
MSKEAILNMINCSNVKGKSADAFKLAANRSK